MRKDIAITSNKTMVPDISESLGRNSKFIFYFDPHNFVILLIVDSYKHFSQTLVTRCIFFIVDRSQS